MAEFKSSIVNILAAMETYGGSFVKQLAVLYARADQVNRARLEMAFPDYFAEYDEMASHRKGDR
jgi:hypothetical protein